MAERKERDGLLRSAARFTKYNLRIVLVILFFAALISMATFGNKGLIQRFKLESEKKTLEKQLDAEIKKSDDLQKEIDELKTSEDKIEKVAREKYGMTKDGEKSYKIIIDSTK